MTMTITPHDDTEFETPGRRRKFTKFALSGVAVLGVGAALTSAAWTDDVFFGGSAESGAIDLDGSTDNVAFYDGDVQGNVDLVIADFVIGPNSIVTKRVWVQNNGDLPLKLATVEATGSGDLFPDIIADPSAEPATVTAVSLDADGILNSGQKAAIDVTVSGDPNWTGSEMQGEVGTIVVHVQGTTDLS